MKKIALAALLALALLPAASFAQVYVNIRPPEPVHEIIGHLPHRGWVWQPGYHAWDGHRYAWHAGVWADAPPSTSGVGAAIIGSIVQADMC